MEPGRETAEYKFKTTAFKRSIESLVASYDDPQVDRAWEVVKVCLEAQVKVDRRDDETLAQARTLMWRDWWLCFLAKPASFALWGLYEEFLLPFEQAHGEEERDRIQETVAALGRAADGKKPARKRKTTSKKPKAKQKEPTLRETKYPHLKVVKNGRE
jgi:hypothetical protein